MSKALRLQDWITVAGNNNIVIQSQSQWLEIEPYQDIAVYLEVSQVTAQTPTTTLDVQTSPTNDEIFFNAITASGVPYVTRSSFATSPTLGVQPIQVVRWASPGTAQPLARFLRWRVNFPAAVTSITFRIWLSLNQAGWNT